jgi:hypothetical protein
LSADSPFTFKIESLRETPENWTIYRRPDENDPAWLELCESIRQTGINTPLEMSGDFYIISGHRRYLAAKAVGLKRIPVLVDHDIRIDPMPSAERIALLTERNKGTRIKSDGELYLEAVAGVDPEAAVAKAQAIKAQVFNKVKTSGLTAVLTAGDIRRTDPSGEREQLLNAVLDIIQEKREAGYLPTGGRNIHYALLGRKVRTSTRKNGYIYGTRRGSADLLSKLLTDARSAGLIDHDAIDDSTRPTCEWPTSGTIGSYIAEELDGLFGGYFLDVHADQPFHVEILCEKNTVFTLLKNHVAYPLRLPLTSLRGYGSFPAARDVAKRFERSGKAALKVIYVSDLDPEGLDMPASWLKYLEHDFKIKADVYRAAVTPAQVQKFKLPPDIGVKLTSSRAKKFIAEHGNQCWELDSMPEQILIDEVKAACMTVLDIDALNRAFAREREADIKLAGIRAAVTAFVTDKFRAELKESA